MARDVKRASREAAKDGWIEFIPDIDDNRSDPTPFAVKILPTTGKAFSKELNSHLNFTGREDKKKREEKTENAMREMFRAHVKEPVNYSYPHKDTGEPLRPTNGVDLYDIISEHGDTKEQSVLVGIFEAISDESKLREGLREISSSQSGPTS